MINTKNNTAALVSNTAAEIHISDIENDMYKNQYLLKSQYAIDIAEAKCKVIADQLYIRKHREVVKSISHRIKSPESIYAKLAKRNLEPTLSVAIDEINDLNGIRVICLYQDDLYEFAELFTNQKDVTVIKTKDYIANPKKSGYRSLHLIIEIPICMNKRTESKRIEIQLRTVPMDCWSVLDYQLCYKKPDTDISSVKDKLKKHSEIIEDLDREMMLVRNEIEQLILP